MKLQNIGEMNDSKKGGNMKVAKILAIAGILMIMLGMTFQVIDYQKQKKNLLILMGKTFCSLYLQ